MPNLNEEELDLLLENKKVGDFRRAITKLKEVETLMETYPDKRYRILEKLSSDYPLIRHLFQDIREEEETRFKIYETIVRRLGNLASDNNIYQFPTLSKLLEACKFIFIKPHAFIKAVSFEEEFSTTSVSFEPYYNEEYAVLRLKLLSEYLPENIYIKNNTRETLEKLRIMIKTSREGTPGHYIGTLNALSQLDKLVTEIEVPKTPLSLKELGINFFQEIQ